ncbi:MAG: LLM class flavin-dependent oxidoreductase [Dehalococcoidia bacterium]
MARLTLSRAVATTARNWLDLCHRADDLDLAGVSGADVAGSDAFVDAALAAAATRKTQVGVLIALPTRSPLQTAVAAANLLAVTGPGRFSLGLGPGSPMVNEDGHGVPFGPPLARLRDYVTAISAILRAPAGAPIRHAGQYYRAAGMGYGFSPEQLPIVIGASGPKMIALATEIADGLGLHLLTARTVLRQRVAQVRSVRTGTFPISAGVLTSVHDDLGEALRRARLEVAAALSFPRFLPRLAELTGDNLAARFGAAVRAGDPASAAALLDDSVVREFAIVSRPETLRAQAASLDFIETIAPVPVGQFCQFVPALGLTAGEWRDSQARVAAALVPNTP